MLLLQVHSSSPASWVKLSLITAMSDQQYNNNSYGYMRCSNLVGTFSIKFRLSLQLQCTLYYECDGYFYSKLLLFAC